MTIAKIEITLIVNGTTYRRWVEPRFLLADVLRHEIGLKGTHIGCEHGVCGACTVLIDGRSARSCLHFAAALDGAEITTVELLARNPDPSEAEIRAALASNMCRCTGYTNIIAAVADAAARLRRETPSGAE